MLNLSGILKKYKDKKPHQQPSPTPLHGRGPHPSLNTPLNPPGLMPGQDVPDDSPGTAFYTGTLAQLQKVYRPGLNELTDDDLKTITSAAAAFPGMIRDNPAGLMKCVFTDYAADAAYLPAHALNVAVLAMRFAVSLNYDEERLARLAAAALLHELGMLSVMHVAGKRERLSDAERETVRGHTRRNRALLERYYAALTEDVVESVAQEHERVDGSGYPGSLAGNSVREYAQLIGICDVYEAISHSRPYRCHGTPLEAVKGLLEEKKGFQRKLLKGFIESIGVFPAGTLVRLNTREVAIVTGINARAPLRPVVTVLFDAHGAKVVEPRRLDLSDHSIIHIEDCLEEAPCP